MTGPECGVCNGTGVVQCVEQDGEGGYEMACPEPVHDEARAKAPEHFEGCHPEHAEAGDNPEGYKPQETENCWHCATPTTRACNCYWCLDFSDGVRDVIYHCPTCRRYWAQMYLRVAEITFGADEVPW